MAAMPTMPTQPIMPSRRPDWLRVRVPTGENYDDLKRLMRSKALHTVCEEARCPNIGECWAQPHGHLHDPGQRLHPLAAASAPWRPGGRWRSTGRSRAAWPRRHADGPASHVVVTSVNRDELHDGGATLFAATIRWIRRLNPDCAVEVLTSDFKGSREALKIVMDARPGRLQPQRRDGAAALQARAPAGDLQALAGRAGMGQRDVSGEADQDRLHARPRRDARRDVDLLRDLRARDMDIITIGQYLRPTHGAPAHRALRDAGRVPRVCAHGREMGFRHVESGPLVRSSYHAWDQVKAAGVEAVAGA